MLDIDKFKLVNDTYGHPTGDMVIKQTAQLCSNLLRDTDYLGRVGGEEFAILLPNMGLGRSKITCRRINDAIANTSFKTSEITFNITIFIGLTAYKNGVQEAANLMKRADSALYCAKMVGVTNTK
ncbi:GGDEF domain-containing protein [Colwellia sp. 1_MG-2023]|uniref:GGDEF domain-containing protein n=1 Tax=Colwellia sp. 1_MG-2023 TaxID=3062649 RepID=UPI0026E1D350|nr:GGDEF domain-containing protein [Colwellia sp. 1_MG-2023]MDO6445431.1 GGDEF domain-containing protein [Colwellia sp. 1_MG-2023]